MIYAHPLHTDNNRGVGKREARKMAHGYAKVAPVDVTRRLRVARMLIMHPHQREGQELTRGKVKSLESEGL